MTEPVGELHPRCRGDRAAALVEFSVVMILLFVLLFGIITYGYMMSFRQSMTQSAAEGARQAATAPRAFDPVTLTYDNAVALQRAQDATDKAVSGFGRTCNSNGLTCTWSIHDCSGATDTAATPDCMTVSLVYDYGGHPLLPAFPLLGLALPNTLSSTSVVQLNDK